MQVPKLRIRAYLLASILSIAICNSNGQLPWQNLQDGLWFCEIQAPLPSHINDSKLSIVKIETAKYWFGLYAATEFEKRARPANEWANDFDLQVVVNAGMYTATKAQTTKGYSKNFGHVNNGHMLGNYNAMMAMHPQDTSLLPFSIVDMTCKPWDSFRNKYNSFCQAMRMIDCEGNPLAWDKRPGQTCSMVVAATDSVGDIFFFFTRSPYTHQSVISFMLGMGLGLHSAIYLEGGPEASLFIQTPDTTISKFGSYISKSWERDDNDHFWNIPNVIGIRKIK
jgi:hypothetical protein